MESGNWSWAHRSSRSSLLGAKLSSKATFDVWRPSHLITICAIHTITPNYCRFFRLETFHRGHFVLMWVAPTQMINEMQICRVRFVGILRSRQCV
jgi:hypothetical protein